MTQILAHRGASRAERQNTIAAFRRAASLGADAVELDVRRTRDGVLVVHHDPDVAHLGLIADAERSDLPGDVPSLGDALDACGGMWVNVEIKNDPTEADFDAGKSIADETVALLRGRDEDQRWLISCFRIETVDRCRALAPEIRTAWLTEAPPPDAVATLLERGHSALHPWHGAVTPDVLRDVHRAGLQVNAWTVDDPQRMLELLAWGIDGICTNVPDVALELRGAARK